MSLYPDDEVSGKSCSSWRLGSFAFPFLRLAAAAATSVPDRLLAVDVIAATGSRMTWDVLDRVSIELQEIRQETCHVCR